MELKDNSVELTEEGIILAETALETNDLWDENDPWARQVIKLVIRLYIFWLPCRTGVLNNFFIFFMLGLHKVIGIVLLHYLMLTIFVPSKLMSISYQYGRFVLNALKAKEFYRRDVQYIVRNGKALIINEVFPSCSSSSHSSSSLCD